MSGYKRPGPKIKVAVGKKYGLLSVLAEAGKSRSGARKVIARCECGTIKEYQLSSLRNGRFRSCGCSRIKNEVGKRYGKLLVTKMVGVNEGGKYLFECQCDCGNKIVTQGHYLRVGDTTSCGCFKKEVEKVNLRDKFEEKRVDGVAMHLFGDKPQKNNTTGYLGVYKYLTRVSRETRYCAHITVNGKVYHKKGFLTAEEAYYVGRKSLERKYLPKV